MNTQIKKAYDKIYVDVHTKQRVLEKLEKRAIQNEFIEENQPIMNVNQKIEKVTVTLNTDSKRKYKKIISVAASFGVVMIMAVVGVFSLTGRQKQPDSNTLVGKVDITAKPSEAPNTIKPQPSKEANTAEPEPTKAANNAKTEAEKIVITKEEFKAGIAKMKKEQWGAEIPSIVYASKDLIIIYDYWGVLVFDNKEKKALGALDIRNYEIEKTQSNGLMWALVNKKGNYINFHRNGTPEYDYLFNLNNLTLEKGKALDSKDIFSNGEMMDEKTTDYLANKYGNRYMISTNSVEIENGKYVTCALKLPDPKKSNKLVTMEDLVIIQFKRGKAKGSEKSDLVKSSVKVIPIK